MSIFKLVSGCICCTAILLATNRHTFAEEGNGRQPPVILLTVDDMNWDSLGVYGSSVENPTPNIDRLAAKSVRFEYAFAQASVCTPSRHVMLSGCHSHTTKSEGFVSITPICPTLPDILRQAGYFTAIINKGVGDYHWDFQADRNETNQGRDPKIYADLVKQVYEDASAKNQPLFLMANTMDPHRPFHGSREQERWSEVASIIPLLKPASRIYRSDEVAVPGFLPDLPPVRTEMAEYYSSVRRADDVVGAIIATLTDLGIAEDAVIVFLSDHGISMPFAKANVYRDSLRIPLMVKLPGNSAGGTVIPDAIVNAIDLAPTMLDLLGYAKPERMQGCSFKNLLQEDWREVEPTRRYTFGYYYQGTSPGRTPMFSVQDRRFGYIVNLFYGTDRKAENSDFGQGATWEAMVNAAKLDSKVRERLRFYRNRVLEELYDYERDPHGLVNLIADPAYADVRRRLLEALDQWMVDTTCDALVAFRGRYDRATRVAYVEGEDAESLDRGGGPAARPVTYVTESFDESEASWSSGRSHGVYLVEPGDGQTEKVRISDKAAIRCLRTDDQNENAFVYFHVHDGLTDNQRGSYPVTVQVSVLDKTPGSLLIQFNSDQSSYADSASKPLIGDGNWKEFEFTLNNARFDNSQHDGSDLRVVGRNGAELFIERVVVKRPTPKPHPLTRQR